jgi:hypothetical protein
MNRKYDDTGIFRMSERCIKRSFHNDNNMQGRRLLKSITVNLLSALLNAMFLRHSRS